MLGLNGIHCSAFLFFIHSIVSLMSFLHYGLSWPILYGWLIPSLTHLNLEPFSLMMIGIGMCLCGAKAQNYGIKQESMGGNLCLVRLLVQLFIARLQYCTLEYKYSRLIPERLRVNLLILTSLPPL